jgi:YtkA-like
MPHARRRGLPGPTLLIAAALLASCTPAPVQRGDEDTVVRTQFEPAPTAVGEVRVQIQVTDQKWRAINGARVTVTAVAPDGRGQVVDTAEGRGAGQYVVDALDFSTPGLWALTVRVEQPGGRWTEVDETVTVGGGNSG